MALDDIDLVEVCAQAAHDAYRSYCEAVGSIVPRAWKHETNERQDAVRADIEDVLAGGGPVRAHVKWMLRMIADGWRWGETLDEAAKLHPALVEYEDLPPDEVARDRIYIAIVNAMNDSIRNAKGKAAT